MLREAQPVRVSSADKAMTISTVFRCVNLISTAVAGLPIRSEKLTGNVWLPYDTGLSRILQTAPNAMTDIFRFLRQTVTNIILYGDAYAIPMREPLTREVLNIILCTPGTVAMQSRLGEYYVNDMINAIEGTYYEEEILRFRGPSLDGIHSMSVIGLARTSLEIGATADNNTLKQFANGGASMGIITNEKGVPGYGEYQGAVLQGIADDLNYRLDQGDRIVALPGKADYKPFVMTAADMQFLESRKFSVEEICRFFSVPPIYVFNNAATDLKALPQAQSMFLQTTLKPYLTTIEQELGLKLIPATKRSKCRFRFSPAELYITDPEARMGYIEKRIQTGTMTVNEGRAEFGLPPIEGGDAPVISANYRLMEEVLKAGGTD